MKTHFELSVHNKSSVETLTFKKFGNEVHQVVISITFKDLERLELTK